MKKLYLLFMFLFAYSFSMCLRAERYSGYKSSYDTYIYWVLDTETGILNIYPSTKRPSEFNYWTNYKTYIRSVVIEERVSTIDHMAFSGCSNLTSITIPRGVSKIGAGAFDGCTSLTSITIPENVSEIGIDAFEGCI